MGNDQLLPAYNVQISVADEYIAVVDVNHYRSDIAHTTIIFSVNRTELKSI